MSAATLLAILVLVLVSVVCWLFVKDTQDTELPSFLVGAAATLFALLAILTLFGCTEITTYYPICEHTSIDLESGVVLVDTLAVPDSACIAGFLEAVP